MRTTAFALLFVAVAGCGSDGISIDEAPEVFRDEYCQYLARCGLVESEAICADLNIGIDLNIDPSLQAAIDAGKVKYDGEKLASCYAAIGGFSCDRTDENGRQIGGDDCRNAITGTVGDGGQCAIDAECKSQVCDVPGCPDACCQGSCVGDAPMPFPRHAGESCESSNDCESHTYCANLVCSPLKAAGVGCTSNNECDYGLGCSGALTARVCKVLPKLGEACPEGTCRDEGTYCDSTMTCKAVGLPGDACMSTRDCATFYGCDATMHCTVGAHEGEMCATGNRCADEGTFCDTASMTCKARQADGATCTSDNQCQSSFCDGTLGMRTCQVEPICI